MTVHKFDKQCQIECDRYDCKNVTPVYPSRDFKQMMGDAKRDGWVTFKSRAGKWLNFCKWVHGDNEGRETKYDDDGVMMPQPPDTPLTDN